MWHEIIGVFIFMSGILVQMIAVYLGEGLNLSWIPDWTVYPLAFSLWIASRLGIYADQTVAIRVSAFRGWAVRYVLSRLLLFVGAGFLALITVFDGYNNIGLHLAAGIVFILGGGLCFREIFAYRFSPLIYVDGDKLEVEYSVLSRVFGNSTYAAIFTFFGLMEIYIVIFG